jgi:hypothetical protein
MDWKEHVAWVAPISITMVAVVFIKYGRDLGTPQCFVCGSLVCRRRPCGILRRNDHQGCAGSRRSQIQLNWEPLPVPARPLFSLRHYLPAPGTSRRLSEEVLLSLRCDQRRF